MTLRKNFSWIATGRFIYAASQWLLLIIIARLTSPEKLGEFTYALAVTSPIIIFTQLNMRAFMITDAKEQFVFANYLATRLLSIMFAIIAIFILALTGSSSFVSSILIVVIGTYKAVESISDIFYGALQKREEMSHIAISVMMHGISTILSMALFIIFFDSILYGAIGIVFLWMIILLMYDIPIASRKAVGVVFSLEHRLKIWQLAKACFPLGIVLGLASLNLNMPVYFVEAELGKEQVGYYSAIAFFILAGRLISGSLVQAVAPRLAQYYYLGEKTTFYRLLIKLVGMATVVGLSGVLIVVVWGDVILGFCYGNEYKGYNNLFIWIMVAGGVGYISQFLGLSLTVGRLFRYMILSNIVGGLIILTLSYLFVPTHGVLGGAFALLGGNVSMLLCNSIAVWQKVSVRIPNYGSTS